MATSEEDYQRAKIVSETARIPWRELQRFFAAGSVVTVAAHLDLVEVACAMAADDKEQVADWLQTDAIMPTSDEQAGEWYAADNLVWAVVLSPFVLVQPVAA